MVIEMKKTNRILIVLIIVFLMVSFSNQVWALKDNLDFYKPTDPTVAESQELIDRVGIVLRSVRNVGAAVSVISLMIIGIKYMLGSVEEKANYKATMWPYVIGCLMVITGTSIVSFIYDSIH